MLRDAVGIRAIRIVLVGRPPCHADQAGYGADDAVQHRQRRQRGGDRLALAQRRISLHWRALGGISRVRHGLPAQRRRADLRDAAGWRRHRADGLAGRGHGDLAGGRDGHGCRKRPLHAIAVLGNAIGDRRAGLADQQQISR
ncbi:hypothetical protein D9M70_480290 [compost metagenome]